LPPGYPRTNCLFQRLCSGVWIHARLTPHKTDEGHLTERPYPMPPDHPVVPTPIPGRYSAADPRDVPVPRRLAAAKSEVEAEVRREAMGREERAN